MPIIRYYLPDGSYHDDTTDETKTVAVDRIHNAYLEGDTFQIERPDRTIILPSEQVPKVEVYE